MTRHTKKMYHHHNNRSTMLKSSPQRGCCILRKRKIGNMANIQSFVIHLIVYCSIFFNETVRSQNFELALSSKSISYTGPRTRIVFRVPLTQKPFKSKRQIKVAFFLSHACRWLTLPMKKQISVVLVTGFIKNILLLFTKKKRERKRFFFLISKIKQMDSPVVPFQQFKTIF